MSALCGVVSLDGRRPDRPAIDPAMHALRHFGPDGHRTIAIDSVVFGHQHLQVTPESRFETLPLETDATLLTADLRLDDRDALCDRLGVDHADRRQTPDGRLLLAAYERWGEQCAEHLVGDFAFAIWDRGRRRLVCGRDHAGTKPFYYHEGPRTFVFASDEFALLAQPGVPSSLDEQAIADRLAGHDADRQTTLFAAIRRLPPGHVLTFDANGSRMRQYWQPDLTREIRYRRDDEYVEAYRDLLTRAVADRLRADHPVASMLSGGLDSPLVSCLAARHLARAGRDRLTTISWVLREDDPWSDRHERGFIRLVLDQEPHIDGHFVTSDGKSVLPSFRFGAGTSSAFGVADHMRETVEIAGSAGARVLLAGFGGDHAATSSGAGDFEELLFRGRWLALWRQIRVRAAVAGGGLARQTVGALRKASRPLWSPGEGGDPWMAGVRERSVIAPDFAARMNVAARLRDGISGERRVLRVRDRQWAALTLGTPERVAEAQHGVLGQAGLDYRLPLLDRRLLEFCLAVPPEQHRRGWGRHLVRRAAVGVLPEALRVRQDKSLPAIGDVVRLIARDATRLAAEIDRVARVPSVGRYIDVAALRRRLTDEIPAACARGEKVVRGTGMALRGLQVARFLAWHDDCRASNAVPFAHRTS